MGPSKLFHKTKPASSLFRSHDKDDSDQAQYHSHREPSPDRQEDDISEKHSFITQALSPRLDALHLHKPRPSAVPSRSQSQRSPTTLNTTNLTAHPIAQLAGPGSSTPASAIDDTSPDAFYRQSPVSQFGPAKDERKKRRFFGIGSSKDTQASHNPASAGTSTKGSNSLRQRDNIYNDPEESISQTTFQTWTNPQTSPTDRAADTEIYQVVDSQDQTHSRNQSTATLDSRRRPSDRGAGHESHWSRAASHFHHNKAEVPSSDQSSQFVIAVAGPALTQSGQYKSPNESIEPVWQEQHSRPSSQQSLDRQSSSQQSRKFENQHIRSNSSQALHLASCPTSSMGPPATSISSGRRMSENKQEQRSDQVREANYQPYAQGAQNISGQQLSHSAAYASQLNPQSGHLRNPSASPLAPISGHAEARNMTPPGRARDEGMSVDHAQVHAKLEELQDKYRKVKKLYFEKEAQVQLLQNSLAHQRLSMSRTSLDDNEYMNRFSRLDGAINNLAFNIRRDWRQVPPWLAPFVNRDAASSQTKEMTAVGRAAISRWLIDELLDRFFHPGLEPALSAQLKIIEKNLWRQASPTPSGEDKEALVSRVSAWRMTTLDGLHESLASPQAAENRATLTLMLVDKLVASLSMMLRDPVPPGIEGGVSMIIELAVGIAANLPVESRDVIVEYVYPGQLVDETYMKTETGLPLLTNPGDVPSDPTSAPSGLGSAAGTPPYGENTNFGSRPNDDTASQDSRETGVSTGTGPHEDKDIPGTTSGNSAKKKGMFGSFISGGGGNVSTAGAAANTSTSLNTGGSNAKKAGSGPVGVAGQQQQGNLGEKREDRVRFCTFMTVEVRGRSVLVKAPVYVRD